MSENRKFRIIVDSKELCTCSGSTPSSVAKKAVKKLCEGSKKIVKFSLKECKRDCKKVCGPYQGHMEKLDKPYKRNGKTITHKAVCAKVLKMKGGSFFNVNDFKRNPTEELTPFFEIKNKCIYIVGTTWRYKYIIFENNNSVCIEMWKSEDGVTSVDISQNLKDIEKGDLLFSLRILKRFLKKDDNYNLYKCKFIQEFLHNRVKYKRRTNNNKEYNKVMERYINNNETEYENEYENDNV